MRVTQASIQPSGDVGRGGRERAPSALPVNEAGLDALLHENRARIAFDSDPACVETLHAGWGLALD